MEDDQYLRLGKISAYTSSYKLSNFVWDKIVVWDYFAKKTVGDQFVRAVDSVSANIAEGFGRYFKKDKIKFYYYSLGSLKESFDWNQKSFKRGLLNKIDYDNILKQLELIRKEIYSLIKFTNEKLKK